MKFSIIFLASFFSLTVFSQESTTLITPDQTKPMLSNGVHLSLLKPFFDLTEKLQIKEATGTASIDYESSGGIGAGYNFLPAGDFGFTTHLAFYEAKMKKSKDSLNFAKAAVNIAYSADKIVALLVGLNTMKFINNRNLEALNLEVGWQAGLNFQFNENFSVSFFNYKMVTSGIVDAGPNFPSYDQISRKVNSEGTEIEFGVTF